MYNESVGCVHTVSVFIDIGRMSSSQEVQPMPDCGGLYSSAFGGDGFYFNS